MIKVENMGYNSLKVRVKKHTPLLLNVFQHKFKNTPVFYTTINFFHNNFSKIKKFQQISKIKKSNTYDVRNHETPNTLNYTDTH